MLIIMNKTYTCWIKLLHSKRQCIEFWFVFYVLLLGATHIPFHLLLLELQQPPLLILFIICIITVVQVKDHAQIVRVLVTRVKRSNLPPSFCINPQSVCAKGNQIVVSVGGLNIIGEIIYYISTLYIFTSSIGVVRVCKVEI